jgi:transcriptional antiterminator NusG
MAMRWYILCCYANFEKQAAASIRTRAAEHGLTHLLDQEVGDGGVMAPIERIIEVRGSRNVDAERTLFPGYVLIHCEMTDEPERLLRAIPQVTVFVGHNNEPMPIADAEIHRICAQELRGSERPQATSAGR